jgi:AraC-like DNA-binding protein
MPTKTISFESGEWTMTPFILPLIAEEHLLPFYVYCVGGMTNQTPIRRPNGYLHYIWLHTVRGAGMLWLDGSEYLLKKETGVLLHPGVPHEYHAVQEPWETHWVAFQGFGVAPLLQRIGLTKSGVFPIGNLPRLDRLLQEIFIASDESGRDPGLKGSAKLYHFLTELKGCLYQDKSRSGEAAYQRIRPVLTYMEQHYASDLSLDQLAALIGTTPQYLCRVFKQTVQMSPIGYLTRLRLQKAKELLARLNDKTVAEISALVGYHDPSYFCSVFKQYEGLSPMEFRRSHR